MQPPPDGTGSVLAELAPPCAGTGLIGFLQRRSGPVGIGSRAARIGPFFNFAQGTAPCAGTHTVDGFER